MAFECMVPGRVSFKKYNFDVAHKFGDLWVANERQEIVMI
jgi:hypothetical protein